MTDKELLNLAAKAAGIDYANGFDCATNEPWNPLTDDGDALRLAVKLKRFPWHGKHPSGDTYVTAQQLWSSYRSEYRDDTVPYGNDHNASTRRAIVRAAAEIGKGMK